MWTPKQLAVALVLVLATACTPTERKDDLRVDAPVPPSAEDSPPPEWKRPFVGTDRLGGGRSKKETHGCTEDSNCAVSCVIDGDCCAELCDCTQVYNVRFLKEIEAYQEAQCREPDCPMAKCPRPTGEPVAVCKAGLCQLKNTRSE